jgi:hypothetical protein
MVPSLLHCKNPDLVVSYKGMRLAREPGAGSREKESGEQGLS